MICPKYTEVLKNIMDNENTRISLDNALNSYPLYEKKSKEEFIPSYIPTRQELNNKILNYYKYREIAFETVGRFIDEIEIAMCEIMPKYNLLFLTADQDFNIIYNVDYVRTNELNRDTNNSIKRSGKSESTDTGTDTASNTVTATGNNSTTANDNSNSSLQIENYNKHVNVDTPQNQLSISNKGINNIDYANEMAFNHDSNSENTQTAGNSSSNTDTSSETISAGTNERNYANATAGESNENSTGNQVENSTETTKGNFGVVSAQDLILKYRETIINIEQMIINDERIKELFFTLY